MRISDWSSDVCSSDLTRSSRPLKRSRSERRRQMPDLLDLAGESLDGRIVQAGAVRRQHGLVSFQRLCSYPLIAQHIKWNALIQERVVRTAEVVDIGYLRTERKRVGGGKSVSVPVDLGGRRVLKK